MAGRQGTAQCTNGSRESGRMVQHTERERERGSGVRAKGRQRYCQRAKELARHERVGERRQIRCWEHDRHEALAAFRLQFCFSNGQGDYSNSDAIRHTVTDPKRYRYRYRGTDNVHPLETKLKILIFVCENTHTDGHRHSHT